ncbi:MAG TPA: hypothetical protein VEP90_19125 [Methylomirabilota bacterium]|nr:hypothetical protein [Methylomirabilota bacterium]
MIEHDEVTHRSSFTYGSYHSTLCHKSTGEVATASHTSALEAREKAMLILEKLVETNIKRKKRYNAKHMKMLKDKVDAGTR